RWYRWGIGMELCAPLEVRGVEGVRALAELAGRLIRRQTTLEAAFPCGLVAVTEQLDTKPA
ncbi:MAG TPA: hypothetical protein PLB04_18580, partial [Nitrospira sp.]|nr:hypothetical protein [Nitrospira sp.]